MVLRKDEKQRFKKFAEMLKATKKREETLKLIGFAECEKEDKTPKFEIDDSLKDEVSNSEKIYILLKLSMPEPTDGSLSPEKIKQQNAILLFYIGVAFAGLNNNQPEEVFNRSIVDIDCLIETEDKKLLELLDNSKNYVFIFSY